MNPLQRQAAFAGIPLEGQAAASKFLWVRLSGVGVLSLAACCILWRNPRSIVPNYVFNFRRVWGII